MDFGSRAFRHRLKRELPRWREEGLLDEQAEATLFERYHLGEDGVSVAAATIYALGAVLIGAGVLSFVAWNWERMGRPAKLLTLGVPLLATHALGFWMWRIGGVLPRLGHALTLVGTLIYGASIGLIAQMFHIHSEPAAGFGVWALGATVAAFAYRSVFHASVGVVVACVWGTIHMLTERSLTGIAPYVATVPFYLFLRLDRSSWLFVLTSLGLGLLTVASTLTGFESGYGFILAGLASAAAMLGFSFEPAFPREARVLGVLAVTVLAYACSFHDVAGACLREEGEFERWGWAAVVIPLFVAALAFAIRNGSRLRERPLTACAGLGIPVILLALGFGSETTATVCVNAVLAVLVFTAVTSAARTLTRGPFWYGSLLGGLVIASRFLEFDTELWLKALVFLACGVAVIAFGIGFERRLQRVG